MTALKTALLSAAAIALAAPAMAGDGHTKKKSGEAMMKSETTIVATTPDTEVMGSVETVGEILQEDRDNADQEIIVDRDDLLEAEFRAMDDDGMVKDNAIVVPGSNDTLTTVTCPAGTEAQIDMTCLVTGNWTPMTN